MKTLQKSILRTWKGVDKMRVSDNITNEMAKKAGLPIKPMKWRRRLGYQSI